MNLYYSQHLLAKSPLGFSLDDVKELIKNSYEYASNLFETKLGRIIPGYQADFMVLFMKPITPISKDNVFAHLFFGVFPEFRPVSVAVAGQTIVKNGTLLNSKIEREIAKTNPLIEAFYKEVKGV